MGTEKKVGKAGVIQQQHGKKGKGDNPPKASKPKKQKKEKAKKDDGKKAGVCCDYLFTLPFLEADLLQLIIVLGQHNGNVAKLYS